MAAEKFVEPIQDHVWPGQEIIERSGFDDVQAGAQQHRRFTVVVFLSPRSILRRSGVVSSVLCGGGPGIGK